MSSFRTCVRITRMALLAVVVAACSGGSDTARPAACTPTRPHFKHSAPIAITATDVTSTSATVRLLFEVDTHGLEVEIYGVDGLHVSSAASVTHGHRAGDAVTIPVTFTAPAGALSYLAVHVTGTFDGRSDRAVVTFPVGQATAESDAAPDVVEDHEGQRVHVREAVRSRSTTR